MRPARSDRSWQGSMNITQYRDETTWRKDINQAGNYLIILIRSIVVVGTKHHDGATGEKEKNSFSRSQTSTCCYNY